MAQARLPKGYDRISTERITKAHTAIERLETSLNAHPDNRYGETGRNHREAIARWRRTIQHESGLVKFCIGCHQEREIGCDRDDCPGPSTLSRTSGARK